MPIVMQPPTIVRPRVLVLDDDPLILAVSLRSLERAGFDVAIAASISEALRVIAGPRLDVALLDYFLPLECGCDLIPLLRRHNPDMRIVVVSGLAQVAEVIHHSLRAGADDVVSKLDADWPALARGEPTPAARARSSLNLSRLRRDLIRGALLVHRRNISATARALGIERTTIQRALRRMTSDWEFGEEEE